MKIIERKRSFLLFNDFRIYPVFLSPIRDHAKKLLKMLWTIVIPKGSFCFYFVLAIQRCHHPGDAAKLLWTNMGALVMYPSTAKIYSLLHVGKWKNWYFHFSWICFVLRNFHSFKYYNSRTLESPLRLKIEFIWGSFYSMHIAQPHPSFIHPSFARKHSFRLFNWWI